MIRLISDGDSMVFRKDSLLLYESEIFTIVIAVLCLSMIPMLDAVLSLLYTFLYLLFVVLIFVYPKLHKDSAI